MLNEDKIEENEDKVFRLSITKEKLALIFTKVTAQYSPKKRKIKKIKLKRIKEYIYKL